MKNYSKHLTKYIVYDNLFSGEIMENRNTEFDKLAENYNEITLKYLGKLDKFRDTAFIYKTNYLEYLFNNEPKTILDFGCGIGSLIPYLHNAFKNTKLYGCDISPESIRVARHNYPYCDFKILKDVNDLQNYEEIDCIIINTVLHHIPQNEHEYWINGLYSILAKKEDYTISGCGEELCVGCMSNGGGGGG
ncbi:MAG: class I SAM-dependent methyltransferase [Spirochaetaceae bacterium]|nr:class I SAM-dependent methyltransferase [Spirochaetaceae bacterium]